LQLLDERPHYLARHEQWVAFIVYPIVRDATPTRNQNAPHALEAIDGANAI
jgi:hypothetical protein